MITTLYIDMPDGFEIDVDFASAFARPVFATADGWSRWRIDLDLAKNEATVRPATAEERAAFEPKRIG
jgi:hypothetical protein